MLTKLLQILERDGPQGLWWRVMNRWQPPATPVVLYQGWLRDHQLATWGVAAPPIAHRFHLIVEAGDVGRRELQATLNSLRYQSHQDWQVSLERADDSMLQLLDTLPAAHRRTAGLAVHDHVDSIIPLAGGDVLDPQALSELAHFRQRHPQAVWVYSDDDLRGPRGLRCDPWFKPDWNPDLALVMDYFSGLVAFAASQWPRLGGPDIHYGGARWYQLALRWADHGAVGHLPRPLVSRLSRAQETDDHRLAVEAYLLQHGRAASVTAHPEWPDGRHIKFLPQGAPLVSIIIPTRDGRNVLERCVDSLYTRTTYDHFELIIVDNGSIEQATLNYLEGLERHGRARIIRDDRPFNFSALNNLAARQARGSVLAFLNNDLEVINGDWLTEMLGLAQRPETGCVGARLWYPDDRLQHAGVILYRGVAAHPFLQLPRDEPGYMGRAKLLQNLSAVTGACLLVRRSVFEQVHGFDEQLAVAFNDVDLCLRIRAAGYRNVWTPHADLYHHESASRGDENTPKKRARFEREIAFMRQRWGEQLLHDPAYNPNLNNERWPDYSWWN